MQTLKNNYLQDNDRSLMDMHTHPHKSTYRVRFTFVFSQAHKNHALFSSRKSYYIPKKEQYKPNSLTIKKRLENITKISYIKNKRKNTRKKSNPKNKQINRKGRNEKKSKAGSKREREEERKGN